MNSFKQKRILPTGVEPVSPVYKTGILPLKYGSGVMSDTLTFLTRTYLYGVSCINEYAYCISEI